MVVGPLLFCDTCLIRTGCNIWAEICVWVMKSVTALRILATSRVTSVTFNLA